MKKIILASQSPRRKQLLEQIGLKFEIESIIGDFYSVVGLPIARIFVELKKQGINPLKN